MTSKPPVVVQGTVVGNPYEQTTAPLALETQRQPQTSRGDDTFTKGEKQETRCRDPFFALLLWGNVAAIAVVAAVYAPEAFDQDTRAYDYDGYMYAVVVTGVVSIAIAGIGLLILLCIPEFLIKFSLIVVVVLSGIWAVLAFLGGAIVAGIFGLIFFAIGICYARAVWPRIPFATINLITAGKAIKSNCGIVVLAYFFAILGFGWYFLWALALMGVWDQTLDCTTNANGTETCTNPNYGYFFLLFLSYFFTQEVIHNTVHVTVAGTVGTWWFSPEEASSCCSSGVRDSLVRSLTTSFGSICFGSLLVAILQALRQLANMARSEDDGILLCIAECILACLESIMQYFNKWAFIYVGVYGYSYIEAGKNVFTLFRNRGWDAIITDDLVGNALFLLSLVTGGIAGAIGIVLDETTDWFDDAGGNSRAVSFVLGFIVGLVIAAILFGVVASGVNAVIVLFADAPAEFQQNYPELSQRMRETWLSIFPGCM